MPSIAASAPPLSPAGVEATIVALPLEDDQEQAYELPNHIPRLPIDLPIEQSVRNVNERFEESDADAAITQVLVLEHLEASINRLTQGVRGPLNDHQEHLEVVGFFKSLARGITMKVTQSKRCTTLCGSTSVTFYLCEDLGGMWCLEKLAGFPRHRYRTLVSFKSIFQVLPTAIWGQTLEETHFRVRPTHRRMGSDVSTRSLILSLGIRNGGRKPTEALLTADSVESSYRFCLLLLFSKKHAGLFDEGNSVASSRASLATGVLKSLAPKPPHFFSSTLTSMRKICRPRANHAGMFSTTTLRVGLVVEVEYHDELMIKVFTADASRKRVDTPVISRTGLNLFGHGMYCLGRIEECHLESNTYTLEYLDGPFDKDEAPSSSSGPKLFRPSTEFVKVGRSFLQVELSETTASHIPFFLVGISLIQVFLFFSFCLTTGVEPTATEPTGGKPYLWLKLVGDGDSPQTSNDDFPNCTDLRPEAWRFLSYGLVHSGMMHLFFNIFIQLLLGIPLEVVHGSLRIGFLYSMGIYSGALTAAMSDVYTNVVGSSGGVYCIIGIHVANLLVNWGELTRSFWNHWSIVFMLSFLVAIEVVETYNNRSETTSYAAHYGGFTAGLLLGIICLRNPILKWREKYILVPLAVLVATIFLGGGTYWVFTTWPPEPIIHLESRVFKNSPCCWQVAHCRGLSEDDYDMFTCQSATEDGSDRITSTLIADGVGLETCSELKAYAVSEN